jgi:hypothetical protein
MKNIAFLLLIFLASFSLKGQSFLSGKTYYSEKEYIEYFAGNMPLILTVPHGGLLVPSTIPNRNCSGCVTVMDTNTQELGRLIADEIKNITGGNCFPHLIINRLRRTKLDANRDLFEAALDNPDAVNAWYAFHKFIDSAKIMVSNQFQRGLLIDLHGHGHANQRLELGYLLSASNLRSGNNFLNSPVAIENSSIRHLALSNKNEYRHAELLNGQESLGGFFETERYTAVPGPVDIAPRSGEDYFSGGYNTERHGSVDSGKIDAIQIECNFKGVRDSEISLQFFAEAAANALVKFLKTHYFGKDGFSCPTSITSNKDINTALSFSVFPNPACESVTLNLPFPGTLRIYNAMGQVLNEFSFLKEGQYNLPLAFNDKFVLLQFIGKDGSSGSMKLMRQCY